MYVHDLGLMEIYTSFITKPKVLEEGLQTTYNDHC